MLENARKQGASIFVYLIFCLLIAIFVINFGPQGGGKGGGGCTGTDNTVIRVNGKDVTQTAYHVAYANPYNRGTGKQHVHVALEMLIRREILAQAAEERGLRATDDMIDEQIKKGRFFLGGQKATIPGAIDDVDGDKFYNHKAVKNWVGQLNVSLNSYREEQKRSYLATMMAEILQDSVQVSRDEALQHFLFEGNTVLYDVVAFRPENYRAVMKLTDADVDRFLATHASEVEARYKADERTYKAVKPQLQLRQIFIAKLEEEKPAAPTTPAPDQGSGAGSAAPAAGSGAGSAAAPPPPKAEAKDEKKDEKKDDKKVADKKDEKKPLGMKIEDAKAKLEAARTAVTAGKEKFEDAAKQLNTDENFKANGGDLGWRTADNASLGEKAVSDAVKTLKPGEMTPVITTDKGAYLVLAVAKREGDLSYDQVKHEIAKEMARDVWGKEAAKRAAITALDKARNGVGLNLDQMYEKEKTPETPGGIDIQQILNDPNLTDEQKQKLLQMMLQQGQKSGAIVIEGKDQPAAWYAQADSPAGSAAAPAAPKADAKAAGSAAPKADAKAAGSAAPKADAKAAGSAAPKAATPAAPKAGAGSAAPAAGSAAAPAAGSAAPAAGSAAPAAGSAAAVPAAGAPPVPAAPADDIKPTSDVLPAFGTVEPPTVARFGPSPRSSTMSGVGSSKGAISALFDELSPGMLAKQIYEGDGGYIVMQLISRSAPKVEDFDKEADRLVEELRQTRAQAFLEGWMKERCEQLVKDNRLAPNPELLRETDDQGKLLPVSYKPCMSFR